MEYYHLPVVHPKLTHVSRMNDHHRCQGKGMYTGMLTTPVSRDVDSVWLNLPATKGIEKKHLETAYHICIFPNVTITILPNHAFLYDHRSNTCKQNKGKKFPTYTSFNSRKRNAIFYVFKID